MENAINTCKVLLKRWKAMIKESEDSVMTTQEACHYLRISRPTYLKHLYVGKIRGVKVGKGWKVLKSELDRFLKGDHHSLSYQSFSSSLSK
jgi:excisionase family DNA binding protein